MKKYAPSIIQVFVLSLLIIVSICYLVGTNQRIQNLIINSDQLTIISLADDIRYNPHFDPFLWNFSRAPYFVPDLALTLVLQTFLRTDAVVAAAMLLLQSAFIAAAGVGLTVLFARARDATVNNVALYGCVMVTALMATQHGWYFGAVLWPYVSYSHAGALDMTLAGLCLVALNLYAEIRRPIVFGLSAIGTLLAYCSDKIFIVLFAPAAFTYILAVAGLKKPRTIIHFCLIQAIALAGMLAVDHTFSFQSMEQNSFSDLWSHFVFVSHFMRSQRVTLQVAIVAAILSTSVILLTTMKAVVTGSPGSLPIVDRLRLLLSLSCLANVSLCIWLWTRDEAAWARYAVMAEFAGPVLVVDLAQTWRASAKRLARTGVPALCVAWLLTVIAWGTTRNPIGMVADQRREGARLEACTRENDLHSGLANYWLARQLSSSTNWRVQVDQFFPTEALPFFWGSDALWFFERLRQGRPIEHDFIILDDLDEMSVFQRYGDSDAIVDCGRHKVAIFRDRQRLQRKLVSQLASTLSSERIRQHLPATLLGQIQGQQLHFDIGDLANIVGRREKGAVILSPANPPGIGLFGPYIALDAGAYKVDLTFTCSGNLDGSYFEITAGEDVRKLSNWLLREHPQVCDGAVQHAGLTVTSSTPLSQVQIRVFYGGQGDLSITQVSLNRNLD